MKKITTTFYDILGISSATICMVHCLIFPIVTILPIGLSHNPFIDLLFALIGFYAIFKIIKNSTLLAASILTISLALIWISVLTEIIFDTHLDLIFLGGMGMIAGHVINYKSHKNRNH